MSATTFDNVYPYLQGYTETKVRNTEITKSKENIYESCEDACINMRKYYPTFHVLPSRILDNFETSRNFDSLKKIDGQMHAIDHFRGFLSTKTDKFSKFHEFDMQYFLELESLDDMAEYVGTRFALTIRRRQLNGESNFQDLVNIVEKDFITHAIWYMETCLNPDSRKMQLFYMDSTGDKQRKRPDEERLYLRDTIAGLTEYKNNLINQYKFFLRKMTRGETYFPGETTAIKLREIKKPYIEKKEIGVVSSVINKVKGFFNKIF